MYDYDEEEDCDSIAERWYVEGAEADRDYWNAAVDPREDEWALEVERRDEEGYLPSEELESLRNMKDEKQLGTLWQCGSCYKEYRVRLPFENLFCSGCFGKLKAYRYLPDDNPKIGYWMLDDASDVECEQRVKESRGEEADGEDFIG